MNSYLNITVRVYTKQAQAALLALDRQLTTTSRTASTASYGAANMARGTASMKAFGNSVQWAGYQLMHAFTIPILAAAGAATKYELANEKAMTNVAKVYGDAALAAKDNGKTIRNELGALRREFESLSNVYGKSQTDVINVAEKWAAAGVSGRALGTAVETTLKEMVIGDLDAVKATTSLISIQAQYGASTKEMQKIMAALNTTENITAVSTGDLIDAFERSASVAAQAGVDYKHLAAIVAAIVPAAGSAAKAGNAIKTIFTDIIVPTKKAADAIQAMGIDIDSSSWLSKTATQRLEELSTKFEKLDGNQKVSVSNYIAGKYQISRFAQMMQDLSKSLGKNGEVLGLNAKGLGNYGKVLDSTKDDAGNLKIAQDELNTVLKSDPQRLKQVWTILKNEAADSVRGLIPFIIQFVTILAGLMKLLSNSSPMVQKWFAIFLIGLAALGPVLLYLAAMSKLIHFIGLSFTGAFKAGKWFLGLFGTMGAEEKALLSLQERVEQLRAELRLLVTPSPFQALTAEAEFLEKEIAKLTGVTVESATTTGKVWTQAALDSALARDAQMTDAEAAAAAQALAEVTAAAETEAAWQTAYTATFRTAETYALGRTQIIQDELGVQALAAADAVKVWVASGEGIVASWISVTEQSAALAWAAARAHLAATIATTAGYARMYSAVTAMNAAAAASEAVKQDAMIATLAYMRAQLDMTGILAKNFTAAALTQGASADFAAASNRNAALVTMSSWMSAYAMVAHAAQAAATAQATAAARASRGAIAGSSAAVIEGTVISSRTVPLGMAEGAAAGAGAATTAAAAGAATRTEGIWAKILSGTKAFGTKFYRLINVLFLGIPGLIGRALAPLGAVITGVFTAAAAAIGIPVGAIIAIILALIAVFLVFRHQITAIMKDVWKGIVAAGGWIWSGLKSIGGFFVDAANMIVHAITALPGVFVSVFKAVVDIVASAAHQVYDLFSYLNPFAHHSPSLVENVTKGHAIIRDEHKGTAASAADHASATAKAHNAVRQSVEQNLGSGPGSPDPTIQQATKDLTAFKNATKNLFPDDFHRNVAEIKKDLPGLAPVVEKLIGDYNRLEAEYTRLGAAVKRQTAVVDAYQATLDRLNARLDTQTKRLTALQKVQSDYGDKLDAAKQRVQDFANTQIEGYGAMDDAIFSNQQAQNALQLQMLKMGDATGGIDKAQAKFASLAGEMEKLRGERNGLQQAGAGSDVTGAYDAQMKGLQGQQTQISTTVAQYNELNAELDRLQVKGQELDLEKSLKFDPLTRQIEHMANAMKELPFDQIISGIQKNQAQVTQYQKSYDDATAAVNKQQKVVDGLTTARDAASDRLDNEQKKLDGLTKKYNEVSDAMDGITQSMQDMSTQAEKAANATDKIKAVKNPLGNSGGLKAATAGAAIGREGGLGDQTDAINADIKKQMDSIAGLTDKMDLFGGVKKKFGSLGRWIKKWIWDEPAKWGDWITSKTAHLAHALWGWVRDGWNSVLSFFKNLPSQLGKLLSKLPEIIGHGLIGITHKFMWLMGWLVGFIFFRLPATLVIGAAKLGIFLLNGFSKGMEAFYAWLIKLPARLGKFLESLPGMLSRLGKTAAVGLFHGIVDGAKAIWDFFTHLPHYLYKMFDNAGNWLNDSGVHILEGLGHGIVAGAKWVWDQVKSFIGDFIQGFKDALGIKSPSTVFMEIGGFIMKGLGNGIIAAAVAIWNFFTNLPGKLIGYLAKAGTWLYKGGKKLIGSWTGRTGFVGGIHSAWDWLLNWVGGWERKLGGYVVKAGDWLYKGGKKLIGSWSGRIGFIGGIHEAWDWLLTWVGGWERKLGGYVVKAGDWLVSGGKKLIGSWNGGGLIGGIHTGWDNLVTWIEGRPDWFKNKFAKAGDWLKQAGKDIGNGLIGALRKVLDGIGDLFSHPVRVVVGVVNTIITLINDVINGVGRVAGIIGMGWHVKGIPKIDVPKGFAQGGQLPASVVGNGFKVNRARAIVGEGNPNFPEYVIPTDPRYRSRAKDLWASVGKDIQMLAGGGRIGPNPGLNETGPDPIPKGVGTGGITGGITDAMVNADRSASGEWIADFLSSEKGWTEKVGDNLDDIIKSVGGWVASTAIKAVWAPVKALVNKGLDHISVPIMKNIGRSWLNGVDDWIDHKGAAQDRKKAPSYGFGYDVDRFAPVAIEGFLRAQHSGNAFNDLIASAQNLPDILHRLNQESGGNPNAINLYDSNAAAGMPSKGIMQVIPPTFDSYKSNQLPNNIWDPRANMFAGLNYAKHAYGSIHEAMTQPGGYAAGGILPMFANGGIASKPTAGVFGEAGREVLAPLDPLWNRLDRIENNSASNLQNGNGGDLTIVINGNLEFPNIRGEDDAEKFALNLKRAVNK